MMNKNKTIDSLVESIIAIKYGLRHKKSGKLLGFYVKSNGDNADGNSTSYILDDCHDNMWLVDESYNAEFVRHVSTEWYNSCYETPTHNFEPEELEVVEVEIIQNIKLVEVKIPTTKEFIEEAYKDDPKELAYFRKNFPHQEEIGYNIYQLKDLLSRRKTSSKKVISPESTT